MRKLVEGPTKNPMEEFLAVSVALLVLTLLTIAFFAFLTYSTVGNP
jgi:hypothetical protein